MLGLPKRDRVSERREATRREILAASWAIAHEAGLTSLTLRDVATRVGMQAPSLYTHFDSKNAIYDAMYGEAWADYEVHQLALHDRVPAQPRVAINAYARHFFDYAVADLPRFQLMNQRILPGFEPSPETYAVAVRVLERARDQFRHFGIQSDDDFDLWVALIAGLINQHHANDPGGTRYAALFDRAFAMWADAVGLPS